MMNRNYKIFIDYYEKGGVILSNSIYSDGYTPYLKKVEFFPMLYTFARHALTDAGKDVNSIYDEIKKNNASGNDLFEFNKMVNFYSLFLEGKKQANLEFILDVDFERDNEIECVGAFCDIFRTYITGRHETYFDMVYIKKPNEDLCYRNTTFKMLLDLCIDLYNDLL